jgi:hypothetical protein
VISYTKTFPKFSAEEDKSVDPISRSLYYSESHKLKARVVTAQGRCPPCEPCDPITRKQECYVWRPGVQECASVMRRCVVYPTPWTCSRTISDPTNCGECIRAGGCCYRKISADIGQSVCS